MVSSEFGQVLDKLLKKDIQERYQSADEVIKDLMTQPTAPLVASPKPIAPLPITSSKPAMVKVTIGNFMK